MRIYAAVPHCSIVPVDARSLCSTPPAAPILLCVLLWGGLGFSRAAAPETGAPHADTTDPRAQRLLIQGITQAQLGDQEEATSYFEAALARSPEAPTLLDALAEAYEEQGDLSTALFYAREAQRHGASRPYHHRRLAEVQRAAGETAAALRTYQQLLDRFPDHSDAHRARASLQAELGQTQAAVQSYKSYLDQAGRAPVAVYEQLLSLYRKTGDAAGIEETLRVLVNRRPTVRTYRCRLAEHYADVGRPKDALTLLAPLARQYPNDEALQKQAARLARQTGQATSVFDAGAQSDSSAVRGESLEALLRRAQSSYDAATDSSPPDTARLRAAEDLLDRVLTQSPEHGAGLALQARLYESWGRPQRAGQALERLLDISPRAPDRWTRTAEAYHRAQEYPRAAEVAEEGMLLFPGRLSLVRTAAFARLHSGASARAHDHFREALSLLDDATGPRERAVLYAGLGLAHERLNRPTKADRVLEKAHSLAPDHPRVLRLYAQSLALRNERLEQALDFAQHARKDAPESPSAHHTLGWVRYRQREFEAARRHLRTALDIGSPHATLLERLGDVEQALGNDAAAQTYWQRAVDRVPDRTSLHQKLEHTESS